VTSLVFIGPIDELGIGTEEDADGMLDETTFDWEAIEMQKKTIWLENWDEWDEENDD